ncbi:hypothetical protein [Bhargavaea ginsengi]|uniref:hypothetical protein n=1 Tax=Bhargavaea ginsengi TaxID=426757 RepID=UPI003C73F5CB
MVQYYVERPPVIGACSYKEDGSDLKNFISDASFLLDDVKDVIVRHKAPYGDISSVLFIYKENREVSVEPGDFLCREREIGGRVWVEDPADFRKAFKSADSKDLK